MNTYATPHTRLSSLVLLIGIACCFPFAVQAQSSSITQISTVSERGVPPAAALAATPVERLAAHWTLFSGGLVDALASGHDGAQQGALRMIIFYGDQLDVKASVFDVVRIYRNHEDDRMRRMAVVALGKMQSRWAIDFLTRSLGFEKTPAVRKTMQAVIAAYHASQHKPAPATPERQVATRDF